MPLRCGNPSVLSTWINTSVYFNPWCHGPHVPCSLHASVQQHLQRSPVLRRYGVHKPPAADFFYYFEITFVPLTRPSEELRECSQLADIHRKQQVDDEHVVTYRDVRMRRKSFWLAISWLKESCYSTNAGLYDQRLAKRVNPSVVHQSVVTLSTWAFQSVNEVQLIHRLGHPENFSFLYAASVQDLIIH